MNIKQLGKKCQENDLAFTYMKQDDGHFYLIEGWDDRGNKLFAKEKEKELCQMVKKVLTDIMRISSLLKKRNLEHWQNTQNS